MLYPWLGCGECIQCTGSSSDEIFCMGREMKPPRPSRTFGTGNNGGFASRETPPPFPSLCPSACTPGTHRCVPHRTRRSEIPLVRPDGAGRKVPHRPRALPTAAGRHLHLLWTHHLLRRAQSKVGGTPQPEQPPHLGGLVVVCIVCVSVFCVCVVCVCVCLCVWGSSPRS